MSRLGVSAAFVFQNAAVANGNGNTMSVDGYTTILISVVSSVAMSGGTTVNFEASTDGTNWTALSGEKIGASPASAATTTADGDFRFNVAGYRKVRCRISAYSAGTTTITGHATMATANAGQPVQVVGGTSQVTGNVASGSADSGNPVKVGGLVSTSTPGAQTTGKRIDQWLGASGQMIIGGVAPASNDGITQAGAMVLDANNTIRALAALGYTFNGATADRVRGNIETAALISAAGLTTSQTGADQTNYNGRGLKVVFDMTVVGTGSVTVTIQGKDPVSGKYFTLLAGAAVITNVTNVYTVYPGIAVAANVSASDVLPRTWRVITTANNANATTYTVAASVIV